MNKKQIAKALIPFEAFVRIEELTNQQKKDLLEFAKTQPNSQELEQKVKAFNEDLKKELDSLQESVRKEIKPSCIRFEIREDKSIYSQSGFSSEKIWPVS
jgi:hypothetical protein